MSSFHITCTTCRSRLKVKDESAVGLILSCPKCGSMVMVSAPGSQDPADAVDAAAAPSGGQDLADGGQDLADGGQHAEPAADSATFAPPRQQPLRDSQQETVDGDFDLPDELLHPQQAREQAPAAEAKGEPGAADTASWDSRPLDDEPLDDEPLDDEPLDDEPPDDGPHGEGQESDNAAGEPSAPPVAGELTGEPLLPDSQWVSQETRQMRQWLLTGAAMVFGVLAAVGLVGFLIARQSSRNVAEARPDAAEGTAEDPAADDPASDDPGPGDAAEADAAEPGGEQTDGEQPDAPQADADGRDSQTPEAAEPDAVDPASAAPDPAAPDAVDPAAADPAAADPDPADPAAADGAAAPLPPVAGAGEGEPDDPQAPAAPPGFDPGDPGGLLGELKGELADFEAMLEEQEAARVARSPQDPDRAGSYDQLRAELAVVRRPRPLHVEAPARMADPLAQVEMDGVPLQQLARFVTELTTVPVTIDGDALFDNGLSPLAPVSCKIVDGDALRLLTAALAPLRLAPQVGERHVLVTHQGGAAAVTARLPADDLAPDAGQQQWLAALVRDVATPGSWRPEGPGQLAWQDGRLAVSQPRPLLFRVLHLLESLRTARELPLRSQAPAERYRLGARRTRAIPGLAKLTSVNFRDPAPLTQVLDKLTEQSGIHFLIDWRALEQERWNPLAEATLLTSNESLARALRMLLIPMDLDHYVVDAELIVITTPAAVAARREIALYPAPDLVPEGADEELALKQLRAALGEQLFTPEAGGVLRLDPASRTLVARLSPAAHRGLQALLDSQRAPQ